MSKPMIRIHDIQTGKVIDREMTLAEFTQYESDQAGHQAKADEQAAKEIAKAALLERLGITEDEAKLLLG